MPMLSMPMLSMPMLSMPMLSMPMLSMPMLSMPRLLRATGGRRTRDWVQWAALAVAFLLAGCGGIDRVATENPEGSAQLEGKLVLTGSSTVAPLMAEIGRRFEEQHPGVRIDVQTGGSSRGIADARSGAADLGMISRGLSAEEGDLQAFTVAQDGICLIVHAENPVQSLSTEQVRAIYTGAVNDWRDVGGEDGPITVVNKAEGRATLEVFQKFFGLTSEEIEADVVIGDNQQGIKTVAGSSSALGYVSIGAADYEVGRGTPIKLLDFGEAQATPETVAHGEFPISRPLNLVVREAPAGLVAAFVEFARSPTVHDLIEAQFFVPVRS